MTTSPGHETSKYPRFRSNVSTPKVAIPEGSWDTAAHVYGDPAIFPLAEGKKHFIPEFDATFDQLLRTHKSMGIERGVLVQATSYRNDHRALLDALSRSGGAYVGVGILSPEVTDVAAEELSRAGVRGARFNMPTWLVADPPTDEEVTTQFARLHDLGWHAVIHVDPQVILNRRELLDQFDGVDVVIDHLGHFDSRYAEHREALDIMIGWLKRDNWWIRLSNPDRGSSQPSGYADMADLMGELVTVAPERTLWGTDWPHVFYRKPVMVDDGELLDLLALAVPDAGLRRQILVDNPDRLYLQT